MKLLLDTISYGRKPTKEEVAAVSARLIKNQVELSPEELIEEILDGFTWTLAEFKEGEDGKLHRTKLCWLSQSIFALDIDNGITPEMALERCRKLKLEPTFMYSSYSDSAELRKFRIVFIANKKVTDYREANAATLALMNIFPEADIQCKDLNRLYYGGKDILFSKLDNTVTVETIIDAYCENEYNEDSTANKGVYKRKIKAFCQRVGLNIINDLPKKCENVASPIIYNIELDVFSPKFSWCASEEEIRTNCVGQDKGEIKKTFKYNALQEKVAKDLIRDFDFEELEASCPLYGDLINGAAYPFENEFMGIALNVLKLKGGEKRLKAAIELMPNAPESQKNYYRNKIGYFKNLQGVSRCENFCPKFLKERERSDSQIVSRCKMCQNEGLNMLHSVSKKRGDIREIEILPTKSLEEAEIELMEAMQEATEAENNDIYVIKAPTGIGKTTALQNIDLRNTLVAYPNHDLGVDIVERLDLKDIIHVQELILEDKNALNEYKALQSIGDYKKARKFLEGQINYMISTTVIGTKERDQAMLEVAKINEYLKNVDESRKSTKTIFCTHARMMSLGNNNIKQYIVDEDILSTVIKTVKLDVNELLHVRCIAKSLGAEKTAKQLDYIISKVEEAINFPNITFELNNILIDKKEIRTILDGANLNINIVDILSLKAVINSYTEVKKNSKIVNSQQNVMGYTKTDLPQKKCIILSATANETVYKEMFKGRTVHFIDLGNVQTQGKLILHPAGMSRSYLAKNINKAIEKVKNEASGVETVITFKSFKDQFSKEGFNTQDMHFGKCVGIDAYNGQDIAIVGTPHANSIVYMLYLHACGIKLTAAEDLQYSTIKRNGFEFSFTTFNGQDLSAAANALREIQFYIIETELIQAIGRARILRTNATVHLFSNLPIQGCKIYK